jgi:wyosine [tRNA(Phe)-imidazoG37] synthetase (radical SAM superfamily)
MDITFGPVPSRRLGRSLGINNIPPKICSYACTYCQLGNTIKMEIERQEFFPPKDIFNSVKERVIQIVKQNETINYLAFVPDGEPTLDINLGTNIESLKSLDIPVAVISNASLIDKQDVRNDLQKADWVSLKVDAVNEKIWRKIDRPYGKLNHTNIKNGMLSFRKDFKGILATETMLIKGMNDTEKNLHETGRFLKELQPDIVYLSIPTRPPADKNVQSANPTTINAAYQILSSYVDEIELLTGYEGNAFSFTGDVRQDILNITSVHPMRKDAVDEILNKAGVDWFIVEKMLQNNEIIQSEYDNHTFFLRKF